MVRRLLMQLTLLVTFGHVGLQESAAAPQTYTLSEQWRVGKEEDDPLLGVVFDAACNADTTYLLDAQLGHILVLGPDGALIRKIGREGEGPGEFRQPTDLIRLGDGTLMIVQSHAPPVYLDPLGTPAEAPPGIPAWDQGVGRQTGRIIPVTHGIVVANRSYEFPPGEMVATLHIELHSKGGPARELHAKQRTLSIPHGPLRERDWEVTEDYLEASPDGSRLYAVWMFDAYTIDVLDASGEAITRIDHPYDPLLRSAARQEYVMHQQRRRTHRIVENYEVEDFERVIWALHPQGDGRLWVLSGRGALERPDGSLGVFDVFEVDGVFAGQVTLMGKGDPVEDAIVFCEDRLLIIRGAREAALTAFGDPDLAPADGVGARGLEVISYALPQ